MSIRSLVVSLLSLLSVTASAYTLTNVTLASNDSTIQYFPNCPSASYPTCKGAWWKIYNDEFNDGVVMTTNGIDSQFSDVEPYFVINFKGSACYLYQWLNASAADDRPFCSDTNNDVLTSFETEYPAAMTGTNLTRVLAYSIENLDPLKEHSVAVQHFTSPGANAPQSIFFDHAVITMTILAPGEETSHKVSVGAIVGAVIGGLLGLSGLVLGVFFILGWKRRRAAHKARAKGFDWQGSHVAPGPMKFMDPGAEIEQSEKIAREGRMEEELEKHRKTLPSNV